MSNRTFLAFLGTGNYQPCTYKYKDKSEKSKYIQIALLKIFCSDFDENDKIRIFVTKSAGFTHWEPNNGSDGLKKEIDALGMRADVKAVDIPDGESEEKLWEIFQAVYDEIDENTSIIFDMTHAFRSLPMFGMTIINYAHYLKNTTLEGIYYGAYEAGGKETGEAPIFDLTPAFDLMTWTTAANSFTKYGVTEELCKRIQWNEEQIGSSKSLSNAIKNMEMTLNYMRGRQIVSGMVFDSCKEKIEQYKQSESVKNIPPLSPILDKVDEKISEFKIRNSLNFVYAVQWYVDHSMPAEALSMLKEGSTTYLLEKNGCNYTDKYLRDILGRRLGGTTNIDPQKLLFKKPKQKDHASKEEKLIYKDKLREYDEKLKKYLDIVENIMKQEQAKNIANIIEDINRFRNDIDHCGFDKDSSTDELDRQTRKAFTDIKTVFGIKQVSNKQPNPAVKLHKKEEKQNFQEVSRSSETSEKSGLPANMGKNKILQPVKQSKGCAVVLFVIAAALGLSMFSIAMFL